MLRFPAAATRLNFGYAIGDGRPATERRGCGIRPLFLSCLLIASVIASTAPATAEGQVGSRTVVGTVRDSAGRPLENAVIALDPAGAIRSTRADAEGRFRFDGVNPGQYALRATWLGYQPVDRTILVPREGLEIAIVLARLPFQLDTMRIVVRRTGIIGTAVQKSNFVALGGVDVEVLGTRHRTRTKSDGLFVFPELREGSYIVLGSRKGFASRILPVPVPSDEAVEIALALDSAATKGQLIVNNRIQDMQMRRRRAGVTTSAIVGRHELLAVGKQSLDVALRYAPSFLYKALIWGNVECVYVDGIPQPNMLAKDFPADAVAMVEVYAGGGTTSSDLNIFLNHGMNCGVGPADLVWGTDKGALRTPGRHKPGTISVVHIWLRK